MIVAIITLCIISTIVGGALICTHLENTKLIRATMIISFLIIVAMFAYGIYAAWYQAKIGHLIGVPEWLHDWAESIRNGRKIII